MHKESVTIDLDQAVLGRLYSRAAQESLRMPELAARLLAQAVDLADDTGADDTIDPSAHVNEARTRATAKTKGEQFKVQDLFTQKEWDAMPLHKTVGRRFAKMALEMGIVRSLPKNNGATIAVYERL